MNPVTTPDAVRTPLAYAGAGDSHARLTKLQAEFSRVLNTPRVFVRHQGTGHFLSGDPGDTMNHPAAGARAGQPRYDWWDRGDGVLYGRLRPNA
jgi:hypothetical protein